MRLALMILPLLLASCANEPTPEEQARLEERHIAAVEAAQTPPPQPLNLQKILYPDIERHRLFGASCAFAPDGGGIGAVALAMASAGYLKIDGEIVRFAPDAGSPELPLGAHQKYTGKEQSFLLLLDEGQGRPSGSETIDFGAELTVRDERDRVVYQKRGLAQCGS